MSTNSDIQNHIGKDKRPKILETIAIILATYAMFLLAISLLGTVMTGRYAPEITSLGLWMVMAAICIWMTHVGLDVLDEQREAARIRKANLNREFNNDSINHIEHDRYDDWREYYADK